MSGPWREAAESFISDCDQLDEVHRLDRAAMVKARGALDRAKEDMRGWLSYVSEYFKEKHHADDDLAALEMALALLDERLEEK